MTPWTEQHLAPHRKARLAKLNDRDAEAARNMSEPALQARVRAICKALGLLVYHTHNSQRSDKGWPDLVIAGSGFLFRELKTEIGKVEPEQATWIEGLNAAGGNARVWRPTDLLSGRIERELTAIRRRT